MRRCAARGRQLLSATTGTAAKTLYFVPVQDPKATRAKADTDRPLKVEEEHVKTQVTYGLVAGLPLLVILFAFLRLWLRRAARRRLSFN